MAETESLPTTGELLAEYELDHGEPVSQGILKAASSINRLQFGTTLYETVDTDALDKIFQGSHRVEGKIITQIWDMTAVITPEKVELYESA